MGKISYSFRERVSYWFDNLMAQGMWAKIKLLLLVTLAFVVIMGTLAALALGGFFENARWSLWKTLMYVLGKGTLDGSEGSPFYVALMFITILYCLFFTAILIGLINNGIRNKMDELAKGQGRVLEEGHTLILGFNDATYVLLDELIEANKNQPNPQCVVVLGEAEWQDMADSVRNRFGGTRSHPKTRIVCKTGSIYCFQDLQRCSIETCRAVIVNGATDFEAIRAIIACAHLMSEGAKNADSCLPYIVSVIRGDENMVEAASAVESAGLTGGLAFLPLSETLARIMVHTSRQPGLSDVFTELFNYSGHEFYIVDDDPNFPQLHGRSIADINLLLKSAFAIGVCRRLGEVVIGPPNTTCFERGDSLVVLQEDDSGLVISQDKVCVTPGRTAVAQDEMAADILILGVRSILGAVLTEYANYLHAGSVIHIADAEIEPSDIVTSQVRELFDSKEIAIQIHNAIIDEKRELNNLLDSCSPDSVLVLVDHTAEDAEADDERTVRILLRSLTASAR